MLDEGDSEERLGLLMALAAWGWGFGESDSDPASNDEYVAAAREAIELARRLGRPDLISGALDTAGAGAGNAGGYGASQAFQEERLLLVPQLDDPAEIADIYGTMAWQLVHIGDYRRAVELPMGDEPGNLGSGVPAVSHRTKYVFHAVARFRLAQWDRFWSVYAMLDAATDHDRPISYHMMRLYGIAAYLKDVAGDPAAADALIAELDRSQASRGNVGVSGARLWIVETLVRRGRFAEARARLAEADPVREVQNRDLDFEAWAALIAAEGSWDEAPPIVAAAREWAERTGCSHCPRSPTGSRVRRRWRRATSSSGSIGCGDPARRLSGSRRHGTGHAPSSCWRRRSRGRPQGRGRRGRPLGVGDASRDSTRRSRSNERRSCWRSPARESPRRRHLVDEPAQVPAQDPVREVLPWRSRSCGGRSPGSSGDCASRVRTSSTVSSVIAPSISIRRRPSGAMSAT